MFKSLASLLFCWFCKCELCRLEVNSIVKLSSFLTTLCRSLRLKLYSRIKSLTKTVPKKSAGNARIQFLDHNLERHLPVVSPPKL